MTPFVGPRSTLLGLGFALGLTLPSCFEGDGVVGLPCSTDDSCGPGYFCALSRCYADGTDPFATCDNSDLDPGELCISQDNVQRIDTGAPLQGVGFGDFTRDNRLDVIVVSEGDLVAFIQQDQGFTTRSLGLDLPENLPLLKSVYAADLVGDEASDVLLLLEEPPAIVGDTRRLILFENTGALQFENARELPGTADVGAVINTGLFSGDFDGNDEPDIASLAVEGVESTLFVNAQFGGAFRDAQPLRLAGGRGSGRVADVNNDGIDDFLSFDFGNNELEILLGSPSGLAAEDDPQVFLVASDPSGMAFADVNDDGMADIVVSHRGGQLTILIGTGDTFEMFEAASVPANDVAAADLDDDGSVDLVTVGEFTAGYSFYEGELGSPFALLSDVGGSRILIEDIDDDLDLDLVIVETGPDRIFFFRAVR